MFESGDAKRLKPANTTNIEPPQDGTKQLTLPQMLGVAPRHAPKEGKKKKENTPQTPAGVVFHGEAEQEEASPQTPKKARETRKAEVLTPARRIRNDIMACASPDGATVHVGTITSPQVISKPAQPGRLLIRTVDLRVQQQEKTARAILFGEAKSTSVEISPTPNKHVMEGKEFDKLKKKGRLSNEASVTTEVVKITAESIKENKGQPRLVKQDDVMKHTAISHMKARGLKPKGITVNYQWGHRIGHTLLAKVPTPEDLEVVGPAANMYESVMTRGLKQAIGKVVDKENMGHWELRVTSHHMQVINKATGESAYHPHISHTQEYEYVYVDQAGSRSEPSLVFKIDPPNPKEVTYEGSTELFAKIFSAVMQGKSFFDSTQQILDFTAAASKPAEFEEMMDTEEEDLPIHRPYAKRKTSARTSSAKKRRTAADLELAEFEEMMDTQEEETLTIHRRKDAKRKTRADEEAEDEDEAIAAERQDSARKSSAKKRRSATRASARTSDAGRHRSTATHEALSGLTFQRIPGDGHCFYNAVALYLGRDFLALRTEVADYIKKHIEEFRAAWPEEHEAKTLEQHIELIRTSNAWADHLEIEALQRLYKQPVIIIRPDANPTIPDNIADYPGEPIFVFYNGRTHYDAMVKEEGHTAADILGKIQEAIDQGESVTHPEASAQHSKNRHTKFFPKPAVYESAAEVAAKAADAAAATAVTWSAGRRGALKI